MDVGTGYRPLEIGEVFAVGDEWSLAGTWREIAPKLVGLRYYGVSCTFRRKVPVEAPSSYPTMSPESKDSMEQYHEHAVELASSVPAESPERKEAGYTVDEVRAAQSPEDVKKVQHIASRASEELDKLADRIFMGQAPSIDPESDVPIYNSACTHVTIPVNHPWVPKPFTPNKYTRNLPTLDGRTVPVDVYCVLAAFPTGSAAVDHAVKKQLAPGQRGHKDRIQDLKEARASLTRAIELEEVQNA